MNEVIRPLPMQLDSGEAERLLRENAPWFYKYRFRGGVESVSMQPLIDEIHQVRADLIFPFLDLAYEGKWSGLRCLDIGCHEGWFSLQLAIRGAKEVVGTDVRDEHIRKASVIQRITGLHNVSFQRGSVYDLPRAGLGIFDLTFFVGLLYHLDNPVGAINAVRAMTRKLCVIETQVAREAPDLECLWGSDEGVHKGPGIVVVRSDPNHVEGDRGVVLVPTLCALYEMLHAAGFNQVYLSIPKPDMYRQYPNLDRVVVMAQA
jgi:tRNA (mo5U34)-methyltransferase